MKKLKLLLPLVASFLFFACSEDNSIYEPQQKEDVMIDQVENEDKNDEDEELPKGQLVVGFHTVKLNVTQPDGQEVERRFKYYMPISVSGNPSLIFEFHGSWGYAKKGAIPDPIKNINVSDPLAQLAIQNNCIVCYPVGSISETATDSNYINWQYSEKELPFFDAMVDYFKGCTPTINVNRIYSTGQSSGAIFSWVLAFERSEVVASIAPRAGRMNTDNETDFPNRCVPARVFAGEDDKTVVHSGLLSDVTHWAERIGGYFAGNVKTDTFTIPSYRLTTTRKWNGAKGDIEIYSLKGIGHGVSLKDCCPYMWEFWNTHTLDKASGNLFITASVNELETNPGKSLSFNINCTEGGVVEVSKVLKGWNVQVNGEKVTVSSPVDFFANIDREGEIVITVTKDGQTASTAIACKLTIAKGYFEFGDIYYNDSSEPVGVVYWVNSENIREAKIVCLEQKSGRTIGEYPDDFVTPDLNDGEVNTLAYVAIASSLGATAANSALVYAAEYNYLGIGNWYLPAINELKTIYDNRTKINEVLATINGKLPTSYTLSSTVVVEEGVKTFKEFHFGNGSVSNETKTYPDPFILVKKVTIQ